MNNVFLGSLLQQIIAAEKVLFLVDRFGSSEEWQLHVCELLQTCYHRGSKVRCLIEGEGGGRGGGRGEERCGIHMSTFLPLFSTQKIHFVRIIL